MKLNYAKAEFISSYFNTQALPPEKRPEVVFVGRSNVGKSSMINKLVNRKNLAFTSSKPGKTAAINYFSIDGKIYIVDLPGYGFAQRSKAERRGWGSLIETYFELGRDIRLVVLLTDIRHGPTEDDKLMYDYLISKGVPFCVAATKSDKISKTAAAKMTQEISELFDVNAFAFSSETGEGTETLKGIIESVTDEKTEEQI
ncbi:MAG: YihA family ribosome biogenesis GTP-binding protein [Clostridia bacterium]|nr:YihA family ribosome biogenesis GTP-binding protein [Clostridia bacterium]